MDATALAALIVAVTGAIGTAIGGIMAAWRYAKAQAKAELLREQSAATIDAKNRELADLQTECDELRAENARLWGLVPEREP